jgi:hypothetical protein
MIGIVKIDKMLVKEVKTTERATSPFAKKEKALEEAPPGHDAIMIIPILNSFGISTKLSIIHAIKGCKTNCAKEPIIIERGCFKISLKLESFNSNPMQNIKKMSTGITIKIEFIFLMVND